MRRARRNQGAIKAEARHESKASAVNNRLVDDAKAKASARSHLPMTLYLCFCAVLEDSAASARAQREHIEGTEGFTAAEREAALRRVRSSGDLEGGGRVEGRQRREELSVGCSRRCPPLPLMHMRKRLRTRLPGRCLRAPGCGPLIWGAPSLPASHYTVLIIHTFKQSVPVPLPLPVPAHGSKIVIRIR